MTVQGEEEKTEFLVQWRYPDGLWQDYGNPRTSWPAAHRAMYRLYKKFVDLQQHGYEVRALKVVHEVYTLGPRRVP